MESGQQIEWHRLVLVWCQTWGTSISVLVYQHVKLVHQFTSTKTQEMLYNHMHHSGLSCFFFFPQQVVIL